MVALGHLRWFALLSSDCLPGFVCLSLIIDKSKHRLCEYYTIPFWAKCDSGVPDGCISPGPGLSSAWPRVAIWFPFILRPGRCQWICSGKKEQNHGICPGSPWEAIFDNATQSSLLLQNFFETERSPSPGKYQPPFPLTPWLRRYFKWRSSAKFILSRLASQKHRDCRLAFLDFDGWRTFLEASELRFLECLDSLYAFDRNVLRLICARGIKRYDVTMKPDKDD